MKIQWIPWGNKGKGGNGALCNKYFWVMYACETEYLLEMKK